MDKHIPHSPSHMDERLELEKTRAMLTNLKERSLTDPSLQPMLEHFTTTFRTLYSRIHAYKNMLEVDKLTGIFSRDGFDSRLQKMVTSVSEKKPQHVTFISVYFDLDKFKAINDQISHDAGDQVLVTFAGILKEATRSSDVAALTLPVPGGENAAREGGDEFKAVFPLILPASLSQAAKDEQVAQFEHTIRSRIISQVKKYRFYKDDAGVAHTALSDDDTIGMGFGVSFAFDTFTPSPDASANDMLDGISLSLGRADQGMHEMKQAGSVR